MSRIITPEQFTEINTTMITALASLAELKNQSHRSIKQARKDLTTAQRQWLAAYGAETKPHMLAHLVHAEFYLRASLGALGQAEKRSEEEQKAAVQALTSYLTPIWQKVAGMQQELTPVEAVFVTNHAKMADHLQFALFDVIREKSPEVYGRIAPAAESLKEILCLAEKAREQEDRGQEAHWLSEALRGIKGLLKVLKEPENATLLEAASGPNDKPVYPHRLEHVQHCIESEYLPQALQDACGTPTRVGRLAQWGGHVLGRVTGMHRGGHD